VEDAMFVLALACGGGAPQPEPTSPVFDPSTGFERTADGAVNRVMDVPSSPEDYPFGLSDCYGSTSQTEPECVPSACTAFPHGRCASESCLSTWCTCVYACTSDADCADDEACLRPEHGLDGGLPMPQCVPAGCRTNADCPSGECGVSVVPDSVARQLELACRTPEDLCRVDADCDSGAICSRSEPGWDCACSHCWCD
jgi:hypothetical protein